jgi:NAD+ diphosphatase
MRSGQHRSSTRGPFLVPANQRQRPPIPFAGDPLDRSANERRNHEWVADQLSAPATRFLPFWRNNPLTSAGDQPELVWVDATVLRHVAEKDSPILLGMQDGVAHFGIDLSPLQEPLSILGLEGAEFADTRAAAGRLPAGQAGTVAHARSLLDWHNRHRYCPACGLPTQSRDAGSMRKCDGCGAEHFPRTDPVVIMVVWSGDRCILGRQRAWAQNFYSAIAGFVDQGETIEEAVRREVKEEVGLDVDEVVYRASQPWPFPSSLMIGCFAHVTNQQENVDAFELDGARWFSRDEIRGYFANPDPVAAGFGLPGHIAIAHHIIKDWSEQSDT